MDLFEILPQGSISHTLSAAIGIGIKKYLINHMLNYHHANVYEKTFEKYKLRPGLGP